MNSHTQKLQQILDQSVDRKKIFGATFSLSSEREEYHISTGNSKLHRPFFLTDITKLFIAALIFKKVSRGQISLLDPIVKFLDPVMVKNLNVIKGEDHSTLITIGDLLSHQSGIADYFKTKNYKGESLEDQILVGRDQKWTFENIIAYSKLHEGNCLPGQTNKAFYSNTNFQILGLILSTIENRSLGLIIEREIAEPLNLQSTYLYTNVLDDFPQAFYYKNKRLIIPRAVISSNADGGMVSTSQELMVFLRAFFFGKLFDQRILTNAMEWKKLTPYISAGIGILQFHKPSIFPSLNGGTELIGYFGKSGTLAYYDIKNNTFITGTINQIAYPELAHKLGYKLLKTFTCKN